MATSIRVDKENSIIYVEFEIENGYFAETCYQELETLYGAQAHNSIGVFIIPSVNWVPVLLYCDAQEYYQMHKDFFDSQPKGQMILTVT